MGCTRKRTRTLPPIVSTPRPSTQPAAHLPVPPTQPLKEVPPTWVLVKLQDERRQLLSRVEAAHVNERVGRRKGVDVRRAQVDGHRAWVGEGGWVGVHGKGGRNMRDGRTCYPQGSLACTHELDYIRGRP